MVESAEVAYKVFVVIILTVTLIILTVTLLCSVYGILSFKTSFEINMTVQGKVSDIHYYPQSFATNPFYDYTQVSFYSGNEISFIGNQLNNFQIGQDYSITYHKIWVAASTEFEILKIEEKP